MRRDIERVNENEIDGLRESFLLRCPFPLFFGSFRSLERGLSNEYLHISFGGFCRTLRVELLFGCMHLMVACFVSFSNKITCK